MALQGNLTNSTIKEISTQFQEPCKLTFTGSEKILKKPIFVFKKEVVFEEKIEYNIVMMTHRIMRGQSKI